MELITLTRQQLREALLTWELLHRDGGCRPYQEGLSLPAEKVAEESSAYLWSLLSAEVPA